MNLYVFLSSSFKLRLHIEKLTFFYLTLNDRKNLLNYYYKINSEERKTSQCHCAQHYEKNNHYWKCHMENKNNNLRLKAGDLLKAVRILDGEKPVEKVLKVFVGSKHVDAYVLLITATSLSSSCQNIFFLQETFEILIFVTPQPCKRCNNHFNISKTISGWPRPLHIRHTQNNLWFITRISGAAFAKEVAKG